MPTNLIFILVHASKATCALIPYLNTLLGFFSTRFHSTTFGLILWITLSKTKPSLHSSYKLLMNNPSMSRELIHSLKERSSLEPSTVSSSTIPAASYSSLVNSYKPCLVLKISATKIVLDLVLALMKSLAFMICGTPKASEL